MERRSDSRKTIFRRAVLRWQGDASAVGVVHDISPGGMLIEIDRTHLPVCEALTVRLSILSGASSREFQLNAVVRRHTANGVVLAFWGIGQADGHALSEALSVAPIDERESIEAGMSHIQND